MTPDPKAINEHGVPHRWLHLFIVAYPRNAELPFMYQGPIDYVDSAMAYPWMWQEPAPDFETLTAWWHVTGFDGLPEQWKSFWYDLRAMKRAAVSHRETRLVGPYWSITHRMQAASVAQLLVGVKNTIRCKAFRDGYVNNLTQHMGVVLESTLRPFLITNLGEEFDETERPDQVRSRSVQHWDGPPPNRPPGSGQV